MEQHLIPLHQGIHLTPSVGEEGQLIDCINLMPKNGSLQNAPVLKEIENVNVSGMTLLYIHKTADGVDHYICSSLVVETGRYQLFDVKAGEQGVNQIGTNTYKPISKIDSIGNTLLVFDEDGMHYILWTEGAYKYLGTHLPEISMLFGHTKLFEYKFFQIDGIEFTNGKIKSSQVSALTETVYAAINKLYAEQVLEDGKFSHPFFVRYAYRLYDGNTLTMHSAPILLNDFKIKLKTTNNTAIIPNPTGAPNTGYTTSNPECVLDLQASELSYYIERQDDINKINDWKDIVQSVDVFISAPLYLYDKSKDIEEVTVYEDTVHGDTVYGLNFVFPDSDQESMNKRIEENSQFYLIDSIPVPELSTNPRTPDLEGKLEALVNREAMTDDYDSHDQLLPQSSFVYNQRLNITNIDKIIFGGFTPRQLNMSSGSCKITTAVTYNINGKRMVARQSDDNVNTLALDYLYYYNPNANAITISIVKDVSGVVSYGTFELKQHNLLQGTYAIIDNEGWTISAETYTETCANTAKIPAATSLDISLPNKVYTSEVNNPFFFPLSGINTVGTGTIRGICAATKALSQGQFGQFPLYVFATDGIWALEVNSDGTYSVKQPVTRDVCNNPKSITQLDNAVLYSTDRGLNVIQGSETRLLTAQLEAAEENLSQIKSDYEALKAPDIFPFSNATHLLSILDEASISYDGINNIAHIYPEDANVGHWMLHLDTMEWTRSSENTPDAFVDGYPNATVQIDDKLYKYQRASITTPNTLRQGFLLTRETAFGDPNTLKVLYDLRTMRRLHTYTTTSGNPEVATEHKGDIRIIPYVSNDRIKWYRLTSLKSHSWKWYRFAVFTNLTDVDTLEGITLITDLRRTNKLR